MTRPAGLGEDEWKAIEDVASRLDRARAAADHALVIGCAKDLCESVARVVINERGEVAQGDDMVDLVNAAQKALETQPGEGVASDDETRKISRALKTIVLALVEIRNLHGTGHGRAAPTGLTPEHSELAYSVALMWVGWALRRLEPYIAGNVTVLVRDLLDGAIFRQGELARRLVAANLARLDESDQRRLGAAVGRRGARGTFTVAKDGIEDAQPGDDARWPHAYIEGVVAGLIFDPNGYVDLGETPGWVVREIARMVGGHPSAADVLRPLVERLARAADAGRVRSNEADRTKAAAEAGTVAQTAGAELAELWQHAAQKLAPRVPA